MLDAISNAKVNEEINIDARYYSSIEFTYRDGLGYSWCAKERNSWSYYRPIASGNNIQFWKTLAGAKRNFIKRISEQ